MITTQHTQPGARFLDLQALVGVTKHIGGFAATDELLSLCHVEDASEVLNVGCGIGVGPCYTAKNYDVRVVGVDLSEKMVEWSRRRAKEEHVQAKVEFHVADVLDLPFETDRFDLVMCESVLIFVDDKARAIGECVRVTKPGGYVGLNEGLWLKQPTPELVAQLKTAIGPYIPSRDTWQALWDASGLQDQVVRIHEVDAAGEVKSRVEWIGWRWLLRAWGRALRLFVTNPAIRQSIKDVFDVPSESFEYFGYGLFVGRKQDGGGSL